MLIRRAEIRGESGLDVRLAGERIAEVGRHLPRRPDEAVHDAAGGALLPGLHDHHVHLLALAASLDSVPCGPPHVEDATGLARALAGARGAGWIRGTGYHESVAGELDRDALDRLAPARPVRIQHRSGAAWILNGAAVQALGLDAGEDARGVERRADGRATGRLFGLDAWLRARLADDGPPDVARVGRLLARLGVTGATDATPHNDAASLEALAALPQRLLVMGPPGLPEPAAPGRSRGAVKILLREDELPTPEALAGTIREAHARGRAVALHCVTRAELVLAAAALGDAGALPGDRVEHASVAPPELVALLAALPVTVVTQPNFVRERGDAYLRDVAPRDRPWLYRCRAWLEAGVPLGGGTDAPFGDPDPWRAMRAAVDRRSGAGAVLGRDEALSPERALALFTTPPGAPGGAARCVATGERADLCLLRVPWKRARDRLDAADVAVTWVGGAILFAG